MKALRWLSGAVVFVVAVAGMVVFSNQEVPALPPPVTLRSAVPGIPRPELRELVVTPEPVFEQAVGEQVQTPIEVDSPDDGDDSEPVVTTADDVGVESAASPDDDDATDSPASPADLPDSPADSPDSGVESADSPDESSVDSPDD